MLACMAGQPAQQTARRTIARRNTYDLVADDIVALMRSRELGPGDPVPTERELTIMYGVGRSSVREALRVLESKGLIKSDGRGSFVTAEPGNPLNESFQLYMSLQHNSLRDVYEVRRIFEVALAGLAASRRDDRDLASMSAAIARLHSIVETDGEVDAERAIVADLEFHLAIAATARNGLAQAIMNAMRDLLRQTLESVAELPDGIEDAVAHHRRILSAIAEADPDRARRAMQDHLEGVEARVRSMLDEPAASAAGQRA